MTTPLWVERPPFWLAYISSGLESEITAIAPGITSPSTGMSPDAAAFIVAVFDYHDEHPGERVVFAGAVTRWLDDQGMGWVDLDVDFYAAINELDSSCPALLIQASQLAMSLVANSARELSLHSVGPWSGPSGSVGEMTEDCRAALALALERDWPAYIRGVLS